MRHESQSFDKPVSHDAQSAGRADPIDQIAYCCIATPTVHDLGMQGRLVAADQHHATDGLNAITGILMWEGQLMIHWLEGSRDALDALWQCIQNDPHQHCLVPLVRNLGISQRVFHTWSMKAATRNEMMVFVREAKERASRSDDAQALQWQHAISTLSILLDPDLTAFYAQADGAMVQKKARDA